MENKNMQNNREDRKNNKISYLTFECSTKCDLDCDFCFSDWRERQERSREMDTESAKSAIKKLCHYGLEAINFTGGEPLLRGDMAELLAYAKSLGLKVILSTNGIMLDRHKDYLVKIASYIDFIGLPLDSSDSEVHDKMRKMRKTSANERHHKLVLRLIERITEEYPHIGIKINTLVSRMNKESVVGLGKLISGRCVSWKLSQFIPSAYGAKHREMFEISEEEYLAVVNACRRENPEANIIATVAHARDPGCRVLSSDGHLLMPDGNRLSDIGDIDSDPDTLFQGLDDDMNKRFLELTYTDAAGDNNV